MTIDYKKQGKKNREKGSEFELKVRHDLEDKGWTVIKNTNNVEFIEGVGNFVKCKTKYNPFTKSMMMNSGGFPDFIIFQQDKNKKGEDDCNLYAVAGVEVKSNGYLSKEEKEKCKWLLENKIFSKILIARKVREAEKTKIKEKIIYTEFNSVKTDNLIN